MTKTKKRGRKRNFSIKKEYRHLLATNVTEREMNAIEVFCDENKVSKTSFVRSAIEEKYPVLFQIENTN